MVPGEPGPEDNVYDLGYVILFINKKDEKDAPYIMIDYEKYWWGNEFVITTLC